MCQFAAFVQGRNFLLPLKESRKERERQELIRLSEMPGSDFFYLYKLLIWLLRIAFLWISVGNGVYTQLLHEKLGKLFNSFLILHVAKICTFPMKILIWPRLENVCLPLFHTRLPGGWIEVHYVALPGGRRGELRRTSVSDGSSLIVVAEIEEIVRNNSRDMLLGLATEIE